MSVLEHIQLTRRGGAVKRFHTVPFIGEQTVAAHTFGVLNIVMRLADSWSPDLVRAVLWHDLSECELGDIPAQAKWKHGNLHAALEANFNYHHQLLTNPLTAIESKLIKFADRMELLLTAIEQARLGNQGAEVIIDRVCEHLGPKIMAQPKHWNRFFFDVLEDYGWLELNDSFLEEHGIEIGDAT